MQGSTLGQRDFSQLTSQQILTLAAATDPVVNVDTNNPTSHLSKILIPRAGMCPLYFPT
jgi:glutaminyl-peptide cyclotransferase